MNVPADQMISAANAFQVKPDRVRKMVQWTERFLAIIGLCFIIWHLCFELTVMTSASMAPTLNGTSYENGDRILLEKLSCRFRTPKRWEIYFYYDTDGNPVAKRVVGLPGERISIRTNAVCINGSPLSRPEARRPVSYYGYGSLANGQEVECGQGYFMLGDSSIDSYDSRYTGVVTRERFRGRVWCIIAPRAHVGFVE